MNQNCYGINLFLFFSSRRLCPCSELDPKTHCETNLKDCFLSRARRWFVNHLQWQNPWQEISKRNKRVKWGNIILLAKPHYFPTYTSLRHRCCTISSKSELSIHATMRNLLFLRRQWSNIQTTSETWLNVNTNLSAQNESFGFLLFSSLERVNLVWSKA